MNFEEKMMLSGSTLWSNQCFTHWGLNKITNILQKIFSDAYSWLKMSSFIGIKISFPFLSNGPVGNRPALLQVMAWCSLYNLFPMVQLMVSLHWLGWWLGTEKATNHCQKQVMAYFTDACMHHSASLTLQNICADERPSYKCLPQLSTGTLKWLPFCRRHFKCIFLSENICILIKIWSLFLGIQLTVCQHWLRQFLSSKQESMDK